MSLNESFDPKNSIELFGLRKNFNFLKGLYNSKKLPNITLISGQKGLGKSTLINHLLFYIFDKKNYNENNFTINAESHFYKLFKTNIFQNIIYYSGDKFKNIKIDDIRNLKKRIYQKSIINDKRFIIFDDIEIINENGLNALLKILEEPTKNNYFILIDNKSKVLKETIKSRCIEFKIILSENEKKNIISSLIKKYNQKIVFDENLIDIAPGNFIKFNHIFIQNKINLDEGLTKIINILINLYKKDKDIIYVDLVLFYTDYFFKSLKSKNKYSIYELIEIRSDVVKNLNDFFQYNLNQNTLLNAINNRLSNE